MSDLFLSVLVLTVPVVAVVLLAVVFGRRLSGTCGGVGPGGSCGRCGRTAAEIPPKGERGTACP